MLTLKINSWSEMLVGTAIGITVVFIALAVMVILFVSIQWLMFHKKKKKAVVSGDKAPLTVQISANEVAAISAAIHLFVNDIHDQESNIITIKRIERRYSPWNSKIYGLNNNLAY